MTIKERYKNSIFIILLALVFGLYFSGSIYFALNTEESIFPDDGHHLTLIEKYRSNWGLIEDAPDTYHFGQVSKQPFLYHWSMGKLLNFNITGQSDRIFIGVISSFISLLTLFINFCVARHITKSKVVQLMSILILSTSLMYVFMSGAPNYDIFNLLFSSIAILFFVRFIKFGMVDDAMVMFVAIALGLLSKISFFPLALILLSLTFVQFVTNYRTLILQISFTTKKRILLFVLLLCTSSIVFFFYGNNYLEYGQLVPDCDKVLTDSQCRSSLQYLRDINFVEANKEVERINVFSYFASWLRLIIDSIFGIYGMSLAFNRSFLATIPYVGVICLGIVSLIRQISIRDKLSVNLLLIALFYTTFIFLFVNYPAYIKSGDHGVGVNGRYLFPVYFLFVILMVKAGYSLVKNQFFQVVMSIIISIWFIYGSYGYYYRYASNLWVENCDLIIELRNCE